jgi:predicted RNase H-like HicB family nuclease
MKLPLPLTVTTLDEETGLWLSHCRLLDLVASGKTPEEARRNLKSCVSYYLRYCYASYRRGLMPSEGSRN